MFRAFKFACIISCRSTETGCPRGALRASKSRADFEEAILSPRSAPPRTGSGVSWNTKSCPVYTHGQGCSPHVEHVLCRKIAFVARFLRRLKPARCFEIPAGDATLISLIGKQRAAWSSPGNRPRIWERGRVDAPPSAWHIITRPETDRRPRQTRPQPLICTRRAPAEARLGNRRPICYVSDFQFQHSTAESRGST